MAQGRISTPTTNELERDAFEQAEAMIPLVMKMIEESRTAVVAGS
jgi:hypothetical protein